MVSPNVSTVDRHVTDEIDLCRLDVAAVENHVMVDDEIPLLVGHDSRETST